MKCTWEHLVAAIITLAFFNVGMCEVAHAEILTNLNNGANQIARWDGTTWNTTFSPTAGAATSITVSVADSRIFTTDGTNDTVRAYDRTTGAHEGNLTGGSLTNPLGLTMGADGNLYVADNAHGGVQRYNASTLAFIDTFIASAPGNNYGIAFSPNGDFWIATRNTGNLAQYSSTGTLLNNFAGFATEAADLTFSATDGMGYVSSNPGGLFSGSGTVFRFDPSDPAGTKTNLGLSTTSGGPSITSIIGVAIDADGTLLASDWCCGANQAIYRYNSSTGAFIEQVGANLGSGNYPDQLWAPGDAPIVPEPSTFALAALGLVGLGWFGYRRQR